MANLNRILLIGRITRDIELRYTPRGTATTDLGLAINRTSVDDQGNKREETVFVDVTLWGKTAEVAQQYLGKGRRVFIEGRLQLDTWDDKQTGQKRSKLKVVGEHLEFLGDRPTQGQGEASAGSKPADNKRQASAPRPQPARDPDLDDEPDDIPFATTIYRDVRRSKLNRRVF
jgi:single-strand DNA-binding protein